MVMSPDRPIKVEEITENPQEKSHVAEYGSYPKEEVIASKMKFQTISGFISSTS